MSKQCLVKSPKTQISENKRSKITLGVYRLIITFIPLKSMLSFCLTFCDHPRLEVATLPNVSQPGVSLQQWLSVQLVVVYGELASHVLLTPLVSSC